MPELGSRVREVILREQLFEKGDMVIVAVSGGADSLALLHTLNALKGEESLPFSIYVAHLNHGLRGRAAREDAAFVREEARRLGLPCTIGEVDTHAFSRSRGLSLEDGARRLRYRFLLQLAQRTGATRVAVGHHRDDQVETLLMNFLRGTGLEGLAGMKFKRPLDEGITLVRPMLEVSREEIERFCRGKGLTPCLDESNLNTVFTRNRIRLQLLPLLEEEFNPGIRRGLQRLSRLLSLDRDFLEIAAAAALTRLLFKEEEHYLVLDGKALLLEHGALQGRMLRLAIRRLLGTVPREVSQYHVRTILKLMLKGSPHGVLHLPGGLRVSRSYDNLTLFYRELPPGSCFVPLTFTVPGEVTLPGTKLGLRATLLPPEKLQWPPDGEKEAFLDFDRVQLLCRGEKEGVKQGERAGEKALSPAAGKLELLVRTRLSGDRFHPLGAPGRRKLKSYLIDQKVPRVEREGIPLVIAGDEIIWVAGRQISHCCRITSQTKQALLLQLERRE
ncbi:MAG: tRNA lysidine(34) synthetase TilS [Bacillota bacterium]